MEKKNVLAAPVVNWRLVQVVKFSEVMALGRLNNMWFLYENVMICGEINWRAVEKEICI